MGMGDSPVAVLQLYAWFSFCLLVYFVHFKPKVGFTSIPAMSPKGEDAPGPGRRAMGGVSVAVLSCGVMRTELLLSPPLTSRASPVHPAPLKHPLAPCAGLMHPKFEQSPRAAMREPCRGGAGCGSAWVSSVPAVADGSLAQKGKH